MFLFAVGAGDDDGATRAIIKNETGYKSKYPIC